MNQLIVYTPIISARIEYTFSTLLKAIGLVSFSFTTDENVYQQSTYAKINYSAKRITEEEIHIYPVSLLFENEIKEPEIVCFKVDGTPAFFKTPEGDFPFDIFAVSFYLISRYEEYLPSTNDEYGRYAHESSVAFQSGFLKLPLVNIWLKKLAILINDKFPAINLQPTSFSYLPTYDIDIAYSYLHKGAFRNMGGFLKSMWSSDWPLVSERLNVLFAKQQDPFDCYQWLDALHKTYRLTPIYFFLVAENNKEYDKNISPLKQAMKSLVKHHSQLYDTGIHPSWQSNFRTQLLPQEINVLNKLSGKHVFKSRQHYIKMELPATYRNLIDAGVTEDYSMGYGSINGFRSSYCLPYLWYDLQKEETTGLTLFPFCYMDANSFYEQHFSPEEALHEMEYYYDIIKQVNGLFITIWHNHFLGTDRMFRGWNNIYQSIITKMDKK